MKTTTVFIGYDIPLALDVKHEQLLPFLDTMLKPVDLGGEKCHIIENEKQKICIEKILSALNGLNDINLNAVFENIWDIESYME
jgi:hypothetical protein